MEKYSAEHVALALREADRMLQEGRSLAEVVANLGISTATYHRWRRRFDGIKATDMPRLKELERENAMLRRIVADKELENEALREIARGTW